MQDVTLPRKVNAVLRYMNKKREMFFGMAQYIDQIGGYIADVPNLDFQRSDGEVFSYYEVSTASMTNTANNLTITGGQGNYPLAYIETDKA